MKSSNALKVIRTLCLSCRLKRYSLEVAKQSGDYVFTINKAQWRHLAQQGMTKLGTLLSCALDVSTPFALNKSRLSRLALTPRGRST
jgi:hypothetical protein